MLTIISPSVLIFLVAFGCTVLVLYTTVLCFFGVCRSDVFFPVCCFLFVLFVVFIEVYGVFSEFYPTVAVRTCIIARQLSTRGIRPLFILYRALHALPVVRYFVEACAAIGEPKNVNRPLAEMLSLLPRDPSGAARIRGFCSVAVRPNVVQRAVRYGSVRYSSTWNINLCSKDD